MEEFLLSEAYSSGELLLFNKEYMENDTYDDRHSIQQTFNKNIVKRIQELEDYLNRPKLLDDQVNIKFLKQNEKIETLEELYVKSILRIEELESQNEAFQEFKYDLSTKLERINDILVVHRNQIDIQCKNHVSLIKVWDEKVLLLIEGKHGR